MTQLYLEILQEHLQACKEDLQGLVLEQNIGDKIEQLAQLKGQIITLDHVSDPREFLLDEDLERLHDENFRTQGSSEDARNQE